MSSIPKKTFMTGQTTLAYAYLTRPDTAFDADGIFKTDFRMSADEAKPLLDEMQSIANEAFGKNASAAHMPYKTDDATGEVVFKTKSRYQPRFVDASGKNVDANSMPPVFGGTTARIAGNITPYDRNGNRGISLQLNAVQVIELAKSQTGAQFGAVEGGFIANDNPEQQGGANYNF